MASVGPLGLFGSTTSSSSAIVINGPIRDKLNMNYGLGALSPFAQANATIGRAWTLMGKNLTNGGIPGDTYQGGQGNQLDYNNCVIAEDEKNSPWTPFHVQMGFKPEENVVSIFGGPGPPPGSWREGRGSRDRDVRRTDQLHVPIHGRWIGRAGDLRPAGGEASGGSGIRHQGKALRMVVEEHDAHGEGFSRSPSWPPSTCIRSHCREESLMPPGTRFQTTR